MIVKWPSIGCDGCNGKNNGATIPRMVGPQGAVSPNFQRQGAVAGEGPRQIGTPCGVRLDLFSGLWERRGRDMRRRGGATPQLPLWERQKGRYACLSGGVGVGDRTDHYSGEM